MAGRVSNTSSAEATETGMTDTGEVSDASPGETEIVNNARRGDSKKGSRTYDKTSMRVAERSSRTTRESVKARGKYTLEEDSIGTAITDEFVSRCQTEGRTIRSISRAPIDVQIGVSKSDISGSPFDIPQVCSVCPSDNDLILNRKYNKAKDPGNYSEFLVGDLGTVPLAGLEIKPCTTNKTNPPIGCSADPHHRNKNMRARTRSTFKPEDNLLLDARGISVREPSTADEQQDGGGKMKFKQRVNDFVVPDGFKLCKKCELLNSPHATECAVCHAILDPGSFMRKRKARKRGSGSDEIEKGANLKVSLTCQLCNKDSDDGYELESCKHGFCRPCVLFVMAEMLSVLPPVNIASSDDALFLLPCPVVGCGCPMSRQDIRTVSGQDTLGFIDDWTLQIMDRRFFSVLQQNCPNCISKPILTSLTSTDHLKNMEHHDIRKALAARGLTCKGGKASCLKRLEGALMCVTSSSTFALCTSCDALVCDECGQELTATFTSIRGTIPNNLPMASKSCFITHECEPNKRQCFTICRCILELNSAFDAYKGGNKSPSDQQQEEAPKLGKAATRSAYSKASTSYSSNGASHQSSGAGDLISDLYSVLLHKALPSDKGKKLSTSKSDTESTNQQHIWNEDGFYSDYKGKHQYIHSETRNAAAEVEKLADKQMKVALHELTLQLSTLTKDGLRLLCPTAALLCSHEVPRKVVHWLIRNDSIMDITSRDEVYFELLSFLRSSGKHSELLPIFCSPHTKYDFWTKPTRLQTQGCMMEDFGKLYKQAKFILFEQQRGTVSVDDEESAVEIVLGAEVKDTYEQLQSQIEQWERTSSHPWNKDADEFFQQVSAFFSPQETFLELHHMKKEEPTVIEAPSSLVHPSQRKSQKGGAGYQDADTEKILTKEKGVGDVQGGITMPSSEEIGAYKKALLPIQFRQEPLLAHHYFRNVKVNGNVNNKSRSRLILKEIASLSTNLPLEWQSSIHVRVDDSRMDLLKALIIGPAGTPYQNGVFLFDLILGEDYPVNPPDMQFLTTGGGRIRFNPNLYDNGKVCLSLLGTWDGPSWQPFESTILQVLVSIQSLVLVDDPYFNEPGYEMTPDCAFAKDYNQQQRMNTLVHSILPALRQPEPSFQDIILTHFRMKRKEIEEQSNSWAEESPRWQYKMMEEAARNVKDELQKLISSD